MKLLYAEDEVSMSEAVVDILTFHKYIVDAVYDGADALAYAEAEQYDGIILDIMMPKMSGLEVLQKLRAQGCKTPILLLTAKSEIEDQIQGLDLGADDYLPKPYSMKELISRINALLRRAYGFGEKEKIVSFGDVCVNITSRSVTKSEKNVSLSLREFDLLAYLCENPNTAIAKDKLLTEVWGVFSAAEPSTLAVHIRWLREKLENDPANPEFIKTVYKVGYMLEVEK